MTIFAIALGLSCFVAGISKLAGATDMRAYFDEFGLGRQGMLAVGALEIAAAVGLQIDALQVWAALGMVLLMIGALVAHKRANHTQDKLAPAGITLVAFVVFLLLST